MSFAGGSGLIACLYAVFPKSIEALQWPQERVCSDEKSSYRGCCGECVDVYFRFTPAARRLLYTLPAVLATKPCTGARAKQHTEQASKDGPMDGLAGPDLDNRARHLHGQALPLLASAWSIHAWARLLLTAGVRID